MQASVTVPADSERDLEPGDQDRFYSYSRRRSPAVRSARLGHFFRDDPMVYYVVLDRATGEHVLAVGLDRDIDPSSWLAPVLTKMAELLQLPEGWNSHRARPIQQSAVRRALEVLKEAMQPDTPPPVVVPTFRGGVQLEWHMDNLDLEVEIRPDGRVLVAYENESGDEWEPHSTMTATTRCPLSWLPRQAIRMSCCRVIATTASSPSGPKPPAISN